MIENAKILVVDDEPDILEFLDYNLRKQGFIVETALDGNEALESITDSKPDLIVLDIMMPGMDGIELCEKIRSNNQNEDIIIAFLTARSESFTHISALESGGDDFITKPIKPKVLVSRVKALLRRHPKFKQKTNNVAKVFGDFEINYEQYDVKIKGSKVNLAKKEFELLKLLTSKPGKVFGRNEILTQVWGSNVIVGDRTIDVHIRKLREKIGSHYIQTMKGVGYKFDF